MTDEQRKLLVLVTLRFSGFMGCTSFMGSIPGISSLHSVDPMLNVSLSFFTKADNTIQTFGTDVRNKEQTWEVIEHDLAR